MISSIWHKAGFHEAVDDKIKVSKDGKWVYWAMYGWNIPGKDVHDIGCEWAYLDDLLALETELERTRKELDVAVDAIKNATEYLGNQEPLVDVMAMNLYTDLSKALEQITAEQKE